MNEALRCFVAGSVSHKYVRKVEAVPCATPPSIRTVGGDAAIALSCKQQETAGLALYAEPALDRSEPEFASLQLGPRWLGCPHAHSENATKGSMQQDMTFQQDMLIDSKVSTTLLSSLLVVRKSCSSNISDSSTFHLER